MYKLLTLFLAFLAVAVSLEGRSNEKFWTLVVVPDTQHYTANWSKAQYWRMQKGFEWIVENRERLNIQFVQGLGDITENWDKDWQWQNAKDAWQKLEGHVGYMPLRGNHDSPDKLNQYFPISQFRGHAHFRGYSQGIQNNFCELKLLGKDYIFLHIDTYDKYSNYDPTGISFAKYVLEKYQKHRVIIATHDIWSTNHIKNQLLSKYSNIILANAGHDCVREARFITNPPGGGQSQNFVVDYQCDNYEDFKIRYYTFFDDDHVEFFTYSPIHSYFESDDSSEGSFYLPK